MKLIIDIDEETYKKCKWKNNGVVGLEWWERAIANGTPIPDNATVCDIEQIRAEIEHEGAMFPDGEFFVSIDRINEIIDRYTKGE